MAFNYASSGPGWRIAGCIDQLAKEIIVAHPDLTCVGTIGNAAHVAEGTSSDHNPFIKGPDGLGIVRAIDIAGPLATLTALQTKLNQIYNAQDDRIWEFGYTHMNGEVTVWDSNPATTLHPDAGDDGHLHVSVTQKNGNAPSSSGYVAAIDDRRPWGIGTAAAPPAPPAPPAPAPAHSAPPWPSIIPRNQYFGLITGPAASHGGYYSAERPYVAQIQSKLNALGYGPIAADGQFGPATAAAVTRFQKAHMPGTKFYGQVWSDDWAKLFSL